MTPLPFNGPLFAHDFILALDRAEKSSRRGRPHYNEKLWFRCLAEADERDNSRRLINYYQARDAAHYLAPTVTYYQRLYTNATAPRMNGKVLHLHAAEPEIRSLAAIRASI